MINLSDYYRSADGSNVIFNNGNSNGADIVIGTNDNYNLAFETGSAKKLILALDALSANASKTSFGTGSATGMYSFAVGFGKAYGDYSHAEGNSSSWGIASHAEGVGTTYGGYSHAEGANTVAAGIYSHAEGYNTLAADNYSHAEGGGAAATGAYSHVEGYNTVTGRKNTTLSYTASSRVFTFAPTVSANFSYVTAGTILRVIHPFGSILTVTVASRNATTGSISATRDEVGFNTSGASIIDNSGSFSHAEGDGTIASGTRSHAEGGNTTASGSYSHAEGYFNMASGVASHAEGWTSEARGIRSHAAGSYAVAAHDRTWLWRGSTTSNNVSTTRTDQFMVSAAGGVYVPGNVGIGTDNNANALTVVGTISTNNHFTSKEWSDAYTNLTANSANYLSGYDLTAIAAASATWDTAYARSTNVANTSATWDAAYARSTVLATASANFILDGGNAKGADIVIGTDDAFNVALQVNNSKKLILTSDTLSGNSLKTSFGSGSATGTYSFAEGFLTEASGTASHAEGSGTIASGENSHAEGSSTIASGYYSHAEGSNTTASGDFTHAEGGGTTASGTYSHAEGVASTASGYISHAEGAATTASGTYSHAEGNSTKARGTASHAAGSYAEAAHDRTWIWKGSTATDVISTTRTDQFMVSAAGGVYVPGNVGIGTDNNANALTVVNDISATRVIYASGGNSANWNAAYNSYNSISGRYTTLDYLSTNNVYLSSTYVADAGYLTNINKTKTGGNVSLVGYNFLSLINSLASTASPALCASTVRAGSMTRAAGIDGFASTVGWGSVAYTVGAALNAAIAANEYYTIPIYSTQNDIITINSIAQFIMIRSPAGPNSIGFLYSTSNNINTATTYSTGFNTLAVPNVNTDISGVINPDLRNTNITIYPGTTGFIFIVPYGATGAGGTLRFVNSYSPVIANDLSFIGNVTPNNYKALTIENNVSVGNNLTVNNNLAVNGNITGNKATFYGNVEIAQNYYNLILKSPNGNRWSVSVTDAGALSATQII